MRDTLLDTLKDTINNRGDLDKLTKAMAEGKAEEFSQTFATLVGKAVLAQKDALPPGLKGDDPRVQAFQNLQDVLGGTTAVATLSQAAGATSGGRSADMAMARAAALNIPFVKGIHDQVKEAAWLERQVYNDAILDPTVDKVYEQWKRDPNTDMHTILQETKSSVFGGSAGALGALARRDGWPKDDAARARKLEEVFKKRREIEEKSQDEARRFSRYLKEIQRMESDDNSILLGEPPPPGKERDQAVVKALSAYESSRTRIRQGVLREVGISEDDYFDYDPFGEDMARLVRQQYRVKNSGNSDPYLLQRLKEMREEVVEKLTKEFKEEEFDLDAFMEDVIEPMVDEEIKQVGDRAAAR